MKSLPPARRRPRKIKTAWAGLGVLTALVMSLLFTRHATRHGAPEPQLETAGARADVLEREGIAPVRYALVNSLWGDYAVPTCRVATVWGDGRKGATFSSTMRLTMRSPVRTPAAAVHAATWVAREKIELAAANDADIAARFVSVEPGAAPVVRIFRSARFKPRQAQFTANAFAAQSALRLAA
ncbi:MAG: hypothetical protein JNM47_01140 [Hyphomonadaceae bacterium]|nr:hypothetical protein [Hyphomonadaceae bacterium]